MDDPEAPWPTTPLSELARNKGGRPRKQIDPDELEKLIALGCTVEEAADFLGIDPANIYRRKGFAARIAKGRASMRLRLRQLQWRSAINGSVVMQIWLGKVLLGQSEPIPAEVTEPSIVQFIVHQPGGIAVCDNCTDGRTSSGDACIACGGTGKIDLSVIPPPDGLPPRLT